MSSLDKIIDKYELQEIAIHRGLSFVNNVRSFRIQGHPEFILTDGDFQGNKLPDNMLLLFVVKIHDGHKWVYRILISVDKLIADDRSLKDAIKYLESMTVEMLN